MAFYGFGPKAPCEHTGIFRVSAGYPEYTLTQEKGLKHPSIAYFTFRPEKCNIPQYCDQVRTQKVRICHGLAPVLKVHVKT